MTMQALHRYAVGLHAQLYSAFTVRNHSAFTVHHSHDLFVQ